MSSLSFAILTLGTLLGFLDAQEQLVSPSLRPEHWQNAQMLPLDKVILDGQCRRLSASEQAALPQLPSGLWQLDNGARVSFKFKGTQAAVYDLTGPGCGAVEINLDRSSTIINRFAGDSTEYRPAVLSIGNGLDGNAIHEVVIRALPEPPDKRKILFTDKLPDLDAHPEKYQGAHWYAGAILLSGTMVK